MNVLSQRGASNKILLGILVFFLLIAIVLVWGFKREPYSTWSEDFSQLELNKHGNLFALSQFYQQQFPKLPQQAWRTWKTDEVDLDQQRQHLLFINDTNHLTQSQWLKLLAWVDKGNHVVLPVANRMGTEPTEHEASLPDDWEDSEALQKEEEWADVAAWAKLQFVKRDWKTQPATESADCQTVLQQTEAAEKLVNNQSPIGAEIRKNWLQNCAQNLNSITLPEGKTVKWLNSNGNDGGFTIAASPNVLWQSKSEAGSHIARIKHGQGSVVLVNSMQPFGNPTDPRYLNSDLNRADHAYLAAYLAQDKQAVWFIDRISGTIQQAPPLWKILWGFSPLFCGVLLALCALFVWRSAYRLGTIKQLSRHENRQLRHYFQAQGDFLWLRQNRQQVLSQLQQQLWLDWQRRIPGLGLLPRPQQLKAVQHIVSVPSNDIEMWLQPLPAKPTSQQWLAYLQAHQHIRNAA